MDHETAFVRAFVVPARRARLAELLRNPKRRRAALDTLYHFRDLDPRWRVAVAPSDQHAQAIASLLVRRGAVPLCHVISTDPEIDGREVPLAEALGRLVGFGHGSFVSCVPGRLGYFEGEGPGDRCILARPPA